MFSETQLETGAWRGKAEYSENSDKNMSVIASTSKEDGKSGVIIESSCERNPLYASMKAGASTAEKKPSFLQAPEWFQGR